MHITRKVTKILPPFFMAMAIILSPTAFAAQYPAEILDLSSWKQTLPVGGNEKPTEIKADKLFNFVQNPFFQLNEAGDGVQFRAPVNGVTTSGSGYPRSELREMTKGGKENASWSTTSGYHAMTIEQAITAVPQKKKHVVAGQIHDAKDDVIVIRLEYPKLFVDINGKPGPVLDEKYELGKKFKIKFAANNGVIDVYYNGGENPVYSLKKKSDGNYFKAGAYTQSNCSKESICDNSNFGEVVVYNLELEHSSGKREPKIVEKTIELPGIAKEKEKISNEESEINQNSRRSYLHELREFLKNLFQNK